MRKTWWNRFLLFLLIFFSLNSPNIYTKIKETYSSSAQAIEGEKWDFNQLTIWPNGLLNIWLFREIFPNDVKNVRSPHTHTHLSELLFLKYYLLLFYRKLDMLLNVDNMPILHTIYCRFINIKKCDLWVCLAHSTYGKLYFICWVFRVFLTILKCFISVETICKREDIFLNVCLFWSRVVIIK